MAFLVNMFIGSFFCCCGYSFIFFPLLLWFSYLEMTLNIAIVYFQSYQKYLQTHTWNHPLSFHASCSENTILDPQTCLQTEH